MRVHVLSCAFILVYAIHVLCIYLCIAKLFKSAVLKEFQ